MKKAFTGALAASFLAAFIPLYVAIQHNAMGEFCKNPSPDSCAFDYLHALGIWGSWFILFFLSLSGILFVARLCVAGFRAVTNKTGER